MSPENLLAESYRSLVLVDRPASETEIKWNAVCSGDSSFWERLKIRDGAIRLTMPDGQELLLAPIGPNDLPPLAETAAPLGRWVARHSLFARILSSRVGKEEVTFYALLNEAHGAGFDRKLDRWLLNIGHAPLCYRRKKVVEFIRRSLLDLVRREQSYLAFMDIGCGGGFDGLDVNRICSALPGVRCRIVNIDIDEKWLGNNELIAKVIGVSQIMRRRASIFDYLRDETYRKDLEGVSHLVISCNGFADFFPDQAIKELLEGIRQICLHVPGSVRFVFAAALKRNRLQTSLSNLIGFSYTGRTPEAIEGLLRSTLGEYRLSFEERHSQIICLVHKD
jgi:SAM-dependent methyltransferase